MILIFDLDDTLYDEKTYALSGIKEVARLVSPRFGLSVRKSFNFMENEVLFGDRKRVFNLWLNYANLPQSLVKECIAIYRGHKPEIKLNESALNLLKIFSNIPKYVVTDGNKLVQSRKIDALNLQKYMNRSLITHRFGTKHAKPSIYCFELIKSLEKCEWNEMIYIGDDPSKDFLNIKPLGVHTVRVLTGRHKDVKVENRYDASNTIKDLWGFIDVAKGII